MQLNLYKNGHVKFQLCAFKESSYVPFFRLQVPNRSYNYSNPFTCIKLALKDLAQFEIDS